MVTLLQPFGSLYLCYCYFNLWEYARAVPHLRDYTANPSTPYLNLVAKVNLSAALINLGDLKPAVDLLNECAGLAEELRAVRLRANILEMQADAKLFENPGTIAPFTGCAAGLNLPTGSTRVIRISYDLGSGFVAMTPDVPITSAAYTMIAETLQGHPATDFLLTNTNSSLSQANVEYAFSNTNWPTLKSLIDGTGGAFMPATPTTATSFNGQRITNVANPTAAQDASTKNYSDTNVGGEPVDMTGVAPGIGNGKILTWDQVAGKWVAATPVSGITALTGDVTASGSGSVAATISNDAVHRDEVFI